MANPDSSGATIAYRTPLSDLPASSVSLTEQPSGHRVPFVLLCHNGTATVSCSAGPVTGVTVAPVAPVPGQTYRLQITSPPAVDTTFRAATSVPATSKAITYRWSTLGSSASYGGSVQVAAMAGASASYPFSGRVVTWYSLNGPSRGVADVFIDGHRVTSVNEHTARVLARVAHRLTHLTGGMHVLTVKARASRGSVTVDAVRVGSAAVVNAPAWTMAWSSGTTRVATLAGESAALTFAGTGVSWTSTASKRAVLAVFVDGTLRTAHNHSVIGLKPGRHQVRLLLKHGAARLAGLQIS